MSSLKVIDLFCGAGGFSLGFEKAGYEITLALDNYLPAIETFNTNHKNKVAKLFDLSQKPDHDVFEKFKLLPNDVDMIIGGPPCQGFSDAKGERIISDKRNILVKRFYDWIENLSPYLFIMENVAGITTIDNGEFFTSLLHDFQEIGYHTQVKILHSALYGVPQKRERTILIGIKSFKNLKDIQLHPSPTHQIPKEMRGFVNNSKLFYNKSEPQTSLLDWFVSDYVQSDKSLLKYTSISTAFHGLPRKIADDRHETTKLISKPLSDEYSRFISDNGKLMETTLHIAKIVKKQYYEIANKIPEGKIYRSNRFGERYVGVWDIYKDEFSEEILSALKFIGKNQNNNSFAIHKGKTIYVREDHLQHHSNISLSQLELLVKDKWIKEVTISGVKGYRLRTKSGLRPRFFRLDRKSISHTILTLDFDAREKLHPTEPRGLSLREGARLQSFPDNFHFYGKFNEIAKQIGNAVPPLLSYKIANHISNVIEMIGIAPFSISN